MSNIKKIVRDREFYANIGRIGGIATRQRMLDKDPNYYSRIGSIGGDTIKKKVETDPAFKHFYSNNGKLGSRAIKEKRNAKKD